MHGHVNVKYIWVIYGVWKKKTVFWTIVLSYLQSAMNPSPPLKPSSTYVYPWRPSTIFGSPGSRNLPAHLPNTSPLSCFLRVWNPLFFCVFHHCPFFVCALPMATFCFNHLDKIRLPVKLVQFSSVPFFFSLFSISWQWTVYFMWDISFKTTPSQLVR